MKKFTKGTLTTLVEDDDRRIAGYRANGWKEEAIKPTVPTDAADKTLAKSIKDANASEPRKGGKKASATDKKVNAAIKANTAAAAESEAVDDGLTSKEGK
jgi:hypothetical protein